MFLNLKLSSESTPAAVSISKHSYGHIADASVLRYTQGL